MKRKITLLLLAAGSMFTMKSQVVFTENFTSPFNPTTSGWLVQNLSNPVGTTSWAQGVGSNYPAFNGAPNDYFTANFNSTGPNPPAGISNWLMTPVLTIYNGAVIEFATKTTFQGAGQPNFAPDRLQLRMSTAGTASTIGAPTTTNSIGTFTDLLLDINPLLGTSTASAVSNGSVNGYPNVWTVYTVQVAGVTGTVTGRFAFRYFVDDAGNGGANSNNIGLDAVKYTLPCEPTVQSFTTCAGASTTLTAVGLPATTYSWDNGATTSSIVVSPVTSTTYTLYPSANSLLCANIVTAVVTVSANLNVNVSAPTTTVCLGDDVTLTASGSANNYAWSTGGSLLGTGAVITVTPPIGTTTYSVGALNGLCTGGNSITITALANPVVNATSASTLVCVNGPSVAVSFTATGANSYIWVVGAGTATSAIINLNVAAQTATTPAVQSQTLGLIGVGANGCIGTDIFTLSIVKSPIIAATSSTANVCTNGTVNITANGAATYSFSGAATSTNNPFTYTAGATAGASQFTVSGTNAQGCVSSTPFSQNVVVCNTNPVGIGENNGYQETAIFPNPFTTEIKINVLDGNVVIYNALGQAVVNTPVHSSQTINTSDLVKGVYIVKAYNSNGELVKSVKLIKN